MPNYYLFRSGDKTHNECLKKMLVGQKDNMARGVKKVKVGDIIFIHKTSTVRNYRSQFIEGPFWATSNGKKDLEPDAWKGKFPWQVKIEKRGDTVKIKQNSFEQFNLHHNFINVFFDFRIPNEIGRKLMEEVGLVQNPIEKKIIDYDAINDEDVDFRLKFPTTYRCQDGHYVRSRAEVIVDDWLYNNGIAHCYEKKIPRERMMCDFYVKWKNIEYYIEVWGGKQDSKDDSIYQNRKKEKLSIYNNNNLNLISIEDKHIQNIDDFLSDYFR